MSFTKLRDETAATDLKYYKYQHEQKLKPLQFQKFIF